MTSLIKENFGQLSITISKKEIVQMEKLSVFWGLRKTHPLTLDGPYLGVDPIAFTTSDYNALFDVFGLHVKDVEKVIRNTPSINRSFVVTSDPFNLLSLWIVHLAPIYIKDQRICRDFQMNVLRYLHWKFFSSIVNNTFRYGTNRGVCEAVIASLSRKSDIIRLESWRRLIESHVEKIVDPKDRFYQTIVDGSPDDMFLRVISESQTSIRAKIITFANAYYETHAAGDSMGFVSSIAQNEEGEKIIAQTASVIDSSSSAMLSEILNPNMFVHDISIEDVSKLFTTISPRMLKTALLKINETAILQASSRTFDKVKNDKDGTLYIGVRVLIIEIIKSMIRLCRFKKVNMGNKAKVFETMKNIYASSRNLDSDILNIKRSISHLVDPFNITVNDASKSALRLAVIYYVVYRTIQKMKV